VVLFDRRDDLLDLLLGQDTHIFSNLDPEEIVIVGHLLGPLVDLAPVIQRLTFGERVRNQLRYQLVE
jgi:hypothetical protein